MFIVYVAHPIGGDVQRNIKLVEERCGEIYQHRPEVIPLAPYIMALKFLDDSNPTDRIRGVAMNKEFFTRRLMDELWLFGPCISSGMWEEICWSRELGIPVVPMNSRLIKELALREIREGNLIRIDCDGPGQQAVIARLISYLPDNEGVEIRNCHYHKKKLLYHKIPWSDVARITLYGIPVESPLRYA